MSPPWPVPFGVLVVSHRWAVVSTGAASDPAPARPNRPSAGREGPSVTTASAVKLPSAAATGPAAFNGTSVMRSAPLKRAVSVSSGGSRGPCRGGLCVFVPSTE